MYHSRRQGFCLSDYGRAGLGVRRGAFGKRVRGHSSGGSARLSPAISCICSGNRSERLRVWFDSCAPSGKRVLWTPLNIEALKTISWLADSRFGGDSYVPNFVPKELARGRPGGNAARHCMHEPRNTRWPRRLRVRTPAGLRQGRLSWHRDWPRQLRRFGFFATKSSISISGQRPTPSSSKSSPRMI